MWWCIKYFMVFGLTGFVLWERVQGTGAVVRPCPAVDPGWFLFVPSLPLWLQPCSYLDPQELVREGCAFPSLSPSLRMLCWFSIWKWVLSIL